MRVLFLISDMHSWLKNYLAYGPSSVTGILDVHRTIKGFIKRKHSVCLLVTKNSLLQDVGINKDLLKIMEIEYAYVPLRNIKIRIRGISILVNFIKWILFITFYTVGAFKTFRRFKPNLIYSIDYLVAPTSAMLAKFFKVPNIFRQFGSWKLYEKLKKPFGAIRTYPEVMPFILPASKIIITNDGTYTDIIARCFGKKNGSFQYWYNGVDFDLFSDNNDNQLGRINLNINPDIKIIITVCRLERDKGVHFLIDVLPELSKSYPEFKLIIVGSGSQENNLRLLIKEKKVTDKVIFAGGVPREEVARYMKIADIFVTLSTVTNLSSVTTEALVAGRCIVALDSGQTSNLIRHMENGLLLKKDELKNLHNVLLRLLVDDALRRKISNNARIFACKNLDSWDERILKEVKLIERLISANSADIGSSKP